METFQQEKETICSLVLLANEVYCSQKDVTRVAKQILNNLCGNKLISKQEALIQATGLPLYECSDQIEVVSISGIMQIGKK